MTPKYICIHGHFYQPPRENAWLETIEIQDSAAPYHDWNARINEECYAPNATARVLNDEQRIKTISNNYGRISWNMGPTLLSWLEAYDVQTYHRIQEADRHSIERFGGHGSAIAQSYNHIIMPLANARDQQTQIKWGIADFEHRFGRKPEGMWLAETAVDTDCLEALVDNGIEYTVLAPRQCKSVRESGSGDWNEVGGAVDPRRAYRCGLPSGREISLFFYDGNVAKAVAFEGLLNDGRFLADKLKHSLEGSEAGALAHIATDGESYGHHHKKGEMALAACLDAIEDDSQYRLTNYGEYLELQPPKWEARIHENSSWSCVHGVERWRSDCGCHTGGGPGWHQRWRAPLRAALDQVRDRLIDVYEREATELFTDVWKARDAYITAILDRSPANVDRFIAEWSRTERVDATQRVRMLRLLEMQRHAMLMYTSCAWFFNEVSGIETLQVLQYANRALHLCEVVTGQDYHDDFMSALDRIESNLLASAGVAYRDAVVPARVGLARVGMHFAASSLFERQPGGLELFTYRSHSYFLHQFQAGTYRLALGKMNIVSRITGSQADLSFAVLYLGQQAIIGEIRRDMPDEEFNAIVPELEREFRVGHVSEVINLMKEGLYGQNFSIWHLFRDEKRKILLQMTDRTLELATASFSDVYYDNYQLMSTMRANDLPLPDSYLASIDFTMHRRLLNLLTSKDTGPDRPRLLRISSDYLHWNHRWKDTAKLERAAEKRIYDLILQAFVDHEGWSWISELLETILHTFKLSPNFYRAQTIMLEGWRSVDGEKLFPVQLSSGLAVARALDLQFGYDEGSVPAANAYESITA